MTIDEEVVELRFDVPRHDADMLICRAAWINSTSPEGGRK